MNKNLGGNVKWSIDGYNYKDYDESAHAVPAKTALVERTTEWTKLEPDQITLPTYDQIYKAAGNKTSEFPIWLYDYLNGTTHSVVETFGYWTLTPDLTTTYYAWDVDNDGCFTSDPCKGSYTGVRPVITINKNQIQ